MTIAGLPTEIWRTIAKEAAIVRSEISFAQEADDTTSVRGLALSCKSLYATVTSVFHENLVLKKYDEFVFLWSVPCHSVRHLRINALLPSRPSSTKNFYTTLSSYAYLTSLSLCTWHPAQMCAHLPTLAFAPTLRRLDLRCAPGRAPHFWDVVEIHLPRLEELRLGASEYLAADEGRYNSPRGEKTRLPGTVEFATSLAARLSFSPSIRVLSLHKTLNELRGENGLPVFLSRANVVAQEDTATRILAKALPNLHQVFWTDPWKTTMEGERCQRATSLRRSRVETGQEEIHLLRS